ncbi:hypothetical protein S245_008677, partial [Arachis hypogaea]
VLYFQRLKHGPLHACQVPKSWIVEWTTNELDKKADYVISQGCIVKNARNKRKQKKQCSSKVVNEGGGVQDPATTLTNHRLPKGRLHLIQAIGRQKR